MKNALILDFYGTIAHKERLDSLLASYVRKDENFYDAGGRAALEAINSGQADAIDRTKAVFFDGTKEVCDHAHKNGLDVKIYSNGYAPFIEKAAELIGVQAKCLDPKAVGDKKQSESYQTIKKQYGYEKMVFVSDSKAEIRAAADGGIERAIPFDPEKPDFVPVHRAIDEIIT